MKFLCFCNTVSSLGFQLMYKGNAWDLPLLFQINQIKSNQIRSIKCKVKHYTPLCILSVWCILSICCIIATKIFLMCLVFKINSKAKSLTELRSLPLIFPSRLDKPILPMMPCCCRPSVMLLIPAWSHLRWGLLVSDVKTSRGRDQGNGPQEVWCFLYT